MMGWMILLLSTTFFMVFLLIRSRLEDKKYLEKKTKETLGEDVMVEIEKERQNFKRRKIKFTRSVNKARTKINNESKDTTFSQKVDT